MLQTKGGVIAFTRYLAVEMALYNIDVNYISPGPIETEGWKNIFADMDMNEAVSIVPFKSIGQPEEAASAVLYLESDDASYITRQALAIEGGSTMV